MFCAEGTGKKATVPTFQEELGHLLGKGKKWTRKPCGIYKHCGVTQDCPQGCRGIRRGCLCSSETLQSSVLYSVKPWLLRCPPSPAPSRSVILAGPPLCGKHCGRTGDVEMNEKPIPALLHLVRKINSWPNRCSNGISHRIGPEGKKNQLLIRGWLPSPHSHTHHQSSYKETPVRFPIYILIKPPLLSMLTVCHLQRS